jgi:hypothetical protein
MDRRLGLADVDDPHFRHGLVANVEPALRVDHDLVACPERDLVAGELGPAAEASEAAARLTASDIVEVGPVEIGAPRALARRWVIGYLLLGRRVLSPSGM